jgi:hypothetical protein
MTDRDHSESTTATWGTRAFGSSAPLEDLLNRFGFTSGRAFEAVKQQLSRNRNMQTWTHSGSSRHAASRFGWII